MKSIVLLLVSTLSALGFAGCATPVAVPTQRTSAVIAAPKEKVWPLLVAEVGLKYPVQSVEKDSGLLTTDFVQVPAGLYNRDSSQWVNPPKVLLGVWNGLRMRMSVLSIEQEPGKTTVKINCHWEALETNVVKSWVIAETNGALENGILTRIEKQLAAAPAQ